MSKLSKAEIILQNLGVTSPSEIQLDVIAFSQNVTIKSRDLEGCEARILGHNDKAIITVNKNSHHQRKRFSIAHELGHWNIDKGNSFNCKKENIGSGLVIDSLSEKLANGFAANLLLPDYLFLPALKQHDYLCWDSIKEIAKKFQTSLTSTAFKIVDSNEYPIMLILYEGRKRKWFHKSRQISEVWFPNNIIETGSIAYSLITDENNLHSDRDTLAADLWFDKGENYTVTEHSIRGANSQIMTILYFSDSRMLLNY